MIDFGDLEILAESRINDLLYQKNDLVKQRNELIAQRKTETLFNIDDVLTKFSKSIKNYDFDEIKVNSIIDELEKEKSLVTSQITEETKKNNNYINKINHYLKKYWEELEIEVDYTDKYLFTHDLKSLSGTILYKMIIAYKLSYMKVLQEKINFDNIKPFDKKGFI